MAEPVFPLLKISRMRMGTDGTGVTSLIAGALCPLHCRWCINQRLLREARPEYVSCEELLERVAVDDLYFRATGGGLAFGGGEALLHAAFINRFRSLCPVEWQLTAETSLAVPQENVSLAAKAVDSFLVDCKDMDPGIYRRYTGGEQQLMEENLKFLLATVGPERVTVRVPLIPEYNSPENQARSAEKLRAMGVEKLELFSYVRRES